MRYIWQHIFSVLDAYANEVPLHHFLKQYYKAHPILGSRDRRGINDAVYAWYRCGKAFGNDHHTREEQVVASLFLCGLQPKALLQFFPKDWLWQATAGERMSVLRQQGYSVLPELIFPDNPAFSAGITKEEWILSLLQQPDLFLRIRKNKSQVTKLLEKQLIPHSWLGESSVALPNGTSAALVLQPDSYVIQDASSQATGAFFKPQPGEQWWDCCSGAGGKSLLLKDTEPSIKLTASDIRPSILHNLKQRFAQYHLPIPETLVIDAADNASVNKMLAGRTFDAILCDVPCTGSGTWARTPEGAYFFDVQELAAYSERGEKILYHAAKYLKPGGRIIFMTCSVFHAENEAVVAAVTNSAGLVLKEQRLINGIDHKADCLFVAVLESVN